MQQCEYCEELRSPSDSRFGRLYAGVAETRIVLRTPSFVVMPTLGQIFRGSLLVLPIAHVETLSALQDRQLSELEDLVQELQTKLGEQTEGLGDFIIDNTRLLRRYEVLIS